MQACGPHECWLPPLWAPLPPGQPQDPCWTPPPHAWWRLITEANGASQCVRHSLEPVSLFIVLSLTFAPETGIVTSLHREAETLAMNIGSEVHPRATGGTCRGKSEPLLKFASWRPHLSRLSPGPGCSQPSSRISICGARWGLFS
jgi:hypothetical protein